MDNTRVYVDDSNFVAFVEGMKSKRVRSLEKSALRKTGGVLRTETRKSLRRAKGSVLSKSKFGKDWYNGIKLSIGETTKGEQYWQVHILGFYMLKWFEMGTNKRRTEKSRGNSYYMRRLDVYGSKQWIHQRGTSPHDTGQIKPLWFFRSAVNANEKRLVETMQNEWKKIIVKEFIQKNGI